MNKSAWKKRQNEMQTKKSITQVKSTIKADAVIKTEIQIYHGKTARCNHRYKQAANGNQPYLHIPTTTTTKEQQHQQNKQTLRAANTFLLLF